MSVTRKILPNALERYAEHVARSILLARTKLKGDIHQWPLPENMPLAWISTTELAFGAYEVLVAFDPSATRATHHNFVITLKFFNRAVMTPGSGQLDPTHRCFMPELVSAEYGEMLKPETGGNRWFVGEKVLKKAMDLGNFKRSAEPITGFVEVQYKSGYGEYKLKVSQEPDTFGPKPVGSYPFKNLDEYVSAQETAQASKKAFETKLKLEELEESHQSNCKVVRYPLGVTGSVTVRSPKRFRAGLSLRDGPARLLILH
jgi:hypothetical protein